jgi:hypothetical protein
MQYTGSFGGVGSKVISGANVDASLVVNKLIITGNAGNNTLTGTAFADSILAMPATTRWTVMAAMTRCLAVRLRTDASRRFKKVENSHQKLRSAFIWNSMIFAGGHCG